LIVEDTGLGIRKEDQPKLLNAFEKVGGKESQKLNPSGVGLGLVISN
jgi:signal transduction histidine kinase